VSRRPVRYVGRRVASAAVRRQGKHRSLAGAWLDEPGLVGEDDGVDAVSQVELGEDVRDVGLDGPLADD
jgi:hypothetical protein